MNPLRPNLPALRHAEYLLVIDLPEALRHKIEKARGHLLETYRIPQPPTGRPHISLARFTVPLRLEDKLIDRLHQIAMEAKPFLVELQDYGSYPMHAIFVRIANQPLIIELIKRFKAARPLMKLAGEDPHFILDPNIALAGRIPRDMYLEAMKEYAQKSFHGRFVAEACWLLKKEEGVKRYQILRRFSFEAVPAQQQRLLFG